MCPAGLRFLRDAAVVTFVVTIQPDVPLHFLPSPRLTLASQPHLGLQLMGMGFTGQRVEDFRVCLELGPSAGEEAIARHHVDGPRGRPLTFEPCKELRLEDDPAAPLPKLPLNLGRGRPGAADRARRVATPVAAFTLPTLLLPLAPTIRHPRGSAPSPRGDLCRILSPARTAQPSDGRVAVRRFSDGCQRGGHDPRGALSTCGEQQEDRVSNVS